MGSSGWTRSAERVQPRKTKGARVECDKEALKLPAGRWRRNAAESYGAEWRSERDCCSYGAEI